MDNALLQRIMQAHGGFNRWQEVESVQVDLNIFGPILITRFKSPWLSNITANIFTDKPYVSFHHFPEQGMTSIFDGFDVYIFDANDHIVCEKNFKSDTSLKTKARLHWDHLDLVYFLGYAMWNYICTPFMLNSDQFECMQGDDWLEADGDYLSTLRVNFPKHIPSHCRQQTFYFNQQGLLQRMDYHTEVLGPVAIGTHVCDQHKTVDGFVFPTHRRVFPRLWNGKALRPLKVMDGRLQNILVNWRASTC